jgi:hypothetical protein
MCILKVLYTLKACLANFVLVAVAVFLVANGALTQLLLFD